MGARISLRHLRCFSAVAETGSFTLAAQRLFVTQSSLTATIKQLEESVELRLFDRTTRRVELTKDAVWFKVVADRILRDFDNAIGDLQAVSKSQRGHIKIAAAPSVMAHLVAPTLQAFRTSYPDIAISVYDEGSDKIERSVLEGEMDFGLSSRLNNFPDLDYMPLMADPFGVVYPSDHPLAGKKGNLTWDDLKDYDYIGLTSDTGIGALLETHPELGLLERSGAYDHASSTFSLYALLKLGGRISILPSLAAFTGSLGEFEFRELHEPRIEREICLITRHLRSHSPSAQRVLEVLMTTIKQFDQQYGVRVY
ncbi:Cyn operon transcriptional activator [Hartmannibacter diazotrophicus]|uniref:Cyn operon transcriptional activator n=1 Tax=Hartmannibacter diazotrophicus TaxID=1482074 RepID=A0A2C9D0Z4_9HYPH|nr:LysR family transcriptional regulator [Hartmannibacter diazotrophicus]SON53893.1 Cyn operon transcriptional activator [Hartmannibacter diazotrophicus]